MAVRERFACIAVLESSAVAAARVSPPGATRAIPTGYRPLIANPIIQRIETFHWYLLIPRLSARYVHEIVVDAVTGDSIQGRG